MSRPPAGCHPDRPHLARRLCGPCYRQARHAGTLDQHPATGRRSSGGVIASVTAAHGVTTPQLLGPSRAVPVIEARRDAARRMRDLGLPWPQIGRHLGGRDHTTAMNLARRPATVPDDPPPLPDDGLCQVEACDRDDSGHLGLCHGHRMRWQRHGDLREHSPLRPIRPDDAPVLDLEQHNRRGYQTGCRCDICRADAVRGVKLNRYRPQSIPVDVGIAAVERLRHAGMSIPQIAAAAGVQHNTLYQWLKRQRDVIYRSTVEKVEAVRLPAPVCPGCGGEPMPGGATHCLRCFNTVAVGDRRKVAS